MFKRLFSIVAAALTLATFTVTAEAQRRDRDRDEAGRWELLGTQTVGSQGERDIIPIGREEGRFTALRIHAGRADVYIRSLRIVYANGYAETFDVNAEIKSGERSRPIDLRGDRAFLKQVELVYRSESRNSRRQAIVDIYGQKAEDRRETAPIGRGPDRDRDGWEVLGTQTVGFVGDRDVIRVGRGEGRFTALMLRVAGNDIFMNEMRIVYENGFSEVVPVRSEIRAGERTQPIDLRGERAFIREIELSYRSRPSFRGQAVVELLGRHDGRGGYAPVRPVAAPVRQQWELLGEKTAEFKADRDIIPVGLREGRFSKVRLKVINRDVDILDMKVVYGNGEVDTLPIRRTVRDEEDGPVFDLPGNKRFIKEVHLTYRTRLGIGGRARVQVWGLQ